MPDMKLVEEMRERGVDLWDQLAWGIKENRRLLDEKASKNTKENWKDKPRTQHMQASAVGSFWQGLVAALAKQAGGADNQKDADTIRTILIANGININTVLAQVEPARTALAASRASDDAGDGEPAPLPADGQTEGVPPE